MTLAPRSTGAVARALQGIDFPADRKKLEEYASRNHAAADVLDVIRHMPEERYSSMADVFKGVGMARR